MKFLSLILYIAVLAVSFVPCTDNLVARADSMLKKELASSDNPAKDHNNTPDNCSPFCTCSCCATSAFYSLVSKIVATKIILRSEKNCLYNETFITEVYHSIWQPPKLVA